MNRILPATQVIWRQEEKLLLSLSSSLEGQQLAHTFLSVAIKWQPQPITIILGGCCYTFSTWMQVSSWKCNKRIELLCQAPDVKSLLKDFNSFISTNISGKIEANRKEEKEFYFKKIIELGLLWVVLMLKDDTVRITALLFFLETETRCAIGAYLGRYRQWMKLTEIEQVW